VITKYDPGIEFGNISIQNDKEYSRNVLKENLIVIDHLLAAQDSHFL
jgi:hypothetical protein